jgi:hypothetical protein
MFAAGDFLQVFWAAVFAAVLAALNLVYHLVTVLRISFGRKNFRHSFYIL